MNAISTTCAEVIITLTMSVAVSQQQSLSGPYSTYNTYKLIPGFNPFPTHSVHVCPRVKGVINATYIVKLERNNSPGNTAHCIINSTVSNWTSSEQSLQKALGAYTSGFFFFPDIR